MSAVDRELGYAGVKAYTVVAGKAVFAVSALRPPDGRARRRARGRHGRPAPDRRRERRRGQAPRAPRRDDARRDRLRLAGRVAGRRDPRRGADGRARRRLLPDARAPAGVLRSVGAEPAESHAEAAAQDVVVTVTTSRDPVLRGEWLREGALVCAVGANDPSKRELDNVVLERASFVCCDSKENARLESGDLIEPVEAGVLDWLEVHELQEVVAGERARAASRTPTSSSSSRTGSPPGTSRSRSSCVRRARERGVGTTL